MGKKQAHETQQAESRRAVKHAAEEVLVLRRWEGKIDAEALNEAMLRLIRAEDAKAGTSEAEQARRSDMSRQELHCVHTSMKSLSLVTLVNWANGKRLDAAFLLGWMVRRLRRKLAT